MVVKRQDPECELCRLDSEHRPAIGHTKHPFWSGCGLCAECIRFYDDDWDDDLRRTRQAAGLDA